MLSRCGDDYYGIINGDGLYIQSTTKENDILMYH